jgi:murein L,D-transpeptidase YafK
MCKKTILILLTIALFFAGPSFASDAKVDSVLVKKSEGKMYLLADGRPVKEYKVVFGANPEGHKQKKGDEKTPEGKYFLDYKKKDSSYYRAIHISYPNAEDIARAKAAGVNPGGQIMIHGQRNGLGWLSWVAQWFNWTDGCIAVTNAEMEEIWGQVKVGTPIEIKP